jgi:crotonobetainyl-CoA:carnitine CoA-transferase CaiB-like acyl-CoA transferase
MANDNIFSGLKVVDLASFVAGPGAAVILSDYGADVIKVEAPQGDLWRIAHKIPPQPMAKDAYAWHLNSRNKRGMTQAAEARICRCRGMESPAHLCRPDGIWRKRT